MRPAVLHADSHADTRELLALMLQSYGITVVGASDGEQAYQAALRIVPAAIVAELVLPGLSGFELARRVKATVSLEHTPMIAWTGAADAHSRQRAAAAGFDRLVIKGADLGIEGEILSVLGMTVSGR